MELGQFSVSLAVKDLKASRAFYETLGFKVFDGKEEEKWLIMRNDSANTVIGIFEGMFEKNILTFNPKDVRSIQKHLKANNITLVLEADENTTDPAHIVLADPDGNQIMFDQF
ncbi:MAG: VOC family protein [Chloroflexota bacterium]|nr:VOC family protein [Chloroflexota bacterium]